MSTTSTKPATRDSDTAATSTQAQAGRMESEGQGQHQHAAEQPDAVERPTECEGAEADQAIDTFGTEMHEER